MAWTSPKTYAGNSAATSADRNTYERDNLNWLANDHPRCRVTRATSQSINNATDTAVTFTTEAYDVGPMHDNGVNPSRLTAPAGGGGIYMVGAFFQMANLTGGRAAAWLRVNSSTDIAISVNAPPSGTGPADVLSAGINLAAGDYVELIVNQNSGGAIALTPAAFWAHWVAF